MLEKELAELKKLLIPIFVEMAANNIGVGKLLISDPNEEDKPIALMIFAVERPKIAALDEFVELLQGSAAPLHYQKFNFDVNSKGEIINESSRKDETNGESGSKS